VNVKRLFADDVGNDKLEPNIPSASNELVGDEQFLVGLSPSFWAHIPMEIQSLVATSSGTMRPTHGGVLLFHEQPVSKCKLVAWIVSADHRGECHYYVVDDGTGLIDVLHYTEDEEVLPPLCLSDDSVNPNHYNPGDVVSIFGKIQYMHGKVEIRAITIIPATPTDETRHWQACRCHPELLSNPLNIVAKLGRNIAGQIRDLANLPATDDSIGLWRLFGASCRCQSGCPIKDDLLYCKCIATCDSHDPDLSYRWKLLNQLLELQNKQTGQLQFPYSSIANSATNGTVVRSAFRTLRKDGILYLYDKENDTYVLLSRSRVLEPFVRRTLTKFANQRPEFLEHVPSARLQIVRRIVLKDYEDKPDG
jgi:hypothetical protein